MALVFFRRKGVKFRSFSALRPVKKEALYRGLQHRITENTSYKLYNLNNILMNLENVRRIEKIKSLELKKI